MAEEPKSFDDPEAQPEPEIAADDAGATTLAEKIAKKAPDAQIDDAEKRRLAEEASRQSDA
jgi:hypothetical protein